MIKINLLSREEKKRLKNREVRPCPSCDGEMRYETRPDSFNDLTFETKAWWCSKCGEASLGPAELANREHKIMKLVEDLTKKKTS